MPAQLTTRAQVNGYRFLLKRIQHALVRRDVRMLHDPMRAHVRSMVVGSVLSILVVAGFAILGFLKPVGSVGDAKIIMGKDSGALFIVREGALHPVVNLASARLLTGSSEKPTSVKESKLASYPRGPMLGIPGAPGALLGSAHKGQRSDWSLCEAANPVGGTARLGFAGVPRLDDTIRPLAADEALLLAIGTRAYLLYDGKRAEVDIDNDVVVRSLKLQGVRPRQASAGVLDATVAVPAFAPPKIPNAGKPGPIEGAKIGWVIRVPGVNTTELYVVVPEGVQRISTFVAEVLRNSDSQGQSDIPAVAPDALRGVQVVHTLPIDNFPATRPKILSPDDYPVTCASWSKTDSDHTAGLTLLTGKAFPLPAAAKPVLLASAGLDSDRLDAAYLRPSTGEFVQTTGIEPGSTRHGALFYVADNGIRYGIPDLATAEILGLGRSPKPAPWQIVGQFPPGPDLSRNRALIAYDAIP
ncbi:MAG: type VII secretion protein EccB [Mycobacteriaceae bacterium]|nr:type VII secretion protein EccB [Mycobacteriaceae bacterium]